MSDYGDVGNEDIPPNRASVTIMRDIDGMLPYQRLLVYEFGYVVVKQTAGHYRNARDHMQFLMNWRADRQRALLAADYVLERKPRPARAQSRAQDIARKADQFFASMR